jgi:Tfp pilus assembly protein PilE
MVRGRPTWNEAGLGVLELVATTVIVAVLLGLSLTHWNGYRAQQRLRYGTAQLATDLRQAQERAKMERRQYTVTLTAGARAYRIASGDGVFVENATLPDGVTPTASTTVVFQSFGQPASAYTLTVRNSTGTGTVTVTLRGGVTYTTP